MRHSLRMPCPTEGLMPDFRAHARVLNREAPGVMQTPGECLLRESGSNKKKCGRRGERQNALSSFNGVHLYETPLKDVPAITLRYEFVNFFFKADSSSRSGMGSSLPIMPRGFMAQARTAFPGIPDGAHAAFLVLAQRPVDGLAGHPIFLRDAAHGLSCNAPGNFFQLLR